MRQTVALKLPYGSVGGVASYRRRSIDDELDELVGALPALALEGPKGVGKTATAQRRAATIVRLDESAQRQIAEADPGRILTADGPVLLDEWQRVPALWDAVRRAVDDGVPPGPFLLTGSAAPADDRQDLQRHSGAGRIDVLRMRPMALSERLDLNTTVSLRALVSGDQTEAGGSSEFGLWEYTEDIISSGFPGIRALSGRARRVRLDGYISRIIDRDFP